MKILPRVRSRNKAHIVRVIRSRGPISRVEIQKYTHFRQATVSLLVRELLDEDVITEAGLSDNPAGRKQILLRLNEKNGFIVAVDFDAEAVVAAAMDLNPAPLGVQVIESTLRTAGVSGLLDQLMHCVETAIASAGLPRKALRGIGIGDPGLVDVREGKSVLSSTIDFWQGVPLRDRFERRFKVPVVIGNNTRTKTLAERMLAPRPASDNMIYIEYGTGIGAGVVVDGHILHGHNWAVGQFGHTHVIEGGPPCKCGSFGCLEAIAGIHALEATIRRAIQEGGYSQCVEMVRGDLAAISGWTVLEAAARGDKMSASILEPVGNSLGLGIANLVNLFNPALIVLDRRLQLAGNDLLEQVKRVVHRQALHHCTRDLAFRFGSLGREAGVFGAGHLILDHLFEPNKDD